jgi:hypothetical protein
MNLATIRIRRPQAFAAYLREISVFIDGTKVGGVKNGGEARFDVPPGGHSIYVKLDFYKSKPFAIDLEQGESAALVCGMNGGLSGLVSAITFANYLYLRSEQGAVPTVATPESATDPARGEQVAVHMDSEEERIPAATEAVHVPKGVKIRVKRSRVVEHTVEVDWTVGGEASLEVGFKSIVSGSIRGEVSQKQGRTTTESETVEYEVEIDGDQSSSYSLRWTDIWCKGAAEFMQGGAIRRVPFRYRDRSELEVLAVTSGS